MARLLTLVGLFVATILGLAACGSPAAPSPGARPTVPPVEPMVPAGVNGEALRALFARDSFRRWETLEEARREVPFPIYSPTQLPDGAHLDSVTLSVVAGREARLRQIYGMPGGGFTLTQTWTPQMPPERKRQGEESGEVTIGSARAVWTRVGNGTSIDWRPSPDLPAILTLVAASEVLSRDDLLAVAASVR